MNYKFYIGFSWLVLLMLMYSCEEPINIKLPEFKKKVVINAYLSELSDDPSHQSIRLSYTSQYTSQNIKTNFIDEAEIKVTNLNNNKEYVFIKDSVTSREGYFSNYDFEAISGVDYALNIKVDDIEFSAQERSYEPLYIDSVWLDYDNLIGGTDDDETVPLKITVESPDTLTYYLLVISNNVNLNNLEVATHKEIIYLDNKFFLQQDFLEYNYDTGITEDEVSTSIFGLELYHVSKSFYSYFRKVQENAWNSGGGPFDIPPAIIKGNCINLSNKDNYPLGYFAVLKGTYKEFKP